MPRAVLAAIAISAVLASCGGSSASEPTSPRFELGRSPDAGISEGHAVADKRAQRCRAAHPRGSRAWRRCNRNAR
jgi:hypothetical protein